MAAAAAVVAVAVLVRFYLPGPWPWRHAAPAAPAVPANGQFYLGVDSAHASLAGYESAAGVTQPAILGGYTLGDNGSVGAALTYVKDLPGTIPLVSWGVDLRNNDVANGSKDGYLTDQAKAVAAYQKPVFIRLDWEMNGNWYPEWSAPAVSPNEYIAAWRHVVDLFHRAGATNAAFVWCPNDGEFDGHPWTTWYPGDDYVDWVGLDAYIDSANQTAEVSGAGGLDELAQFSQKSGNPAMLAEWAPRTPSQSPEAAVDAVLDWAIRSPTTVKALVYFNYKSAQRDDLLADNPTGAAHLRQFLGQHPSDLFGVGTVS